MLEVCTKFVTHNRVDIAIVTPNRAALSAIQQSRVQDTSRHFRGVKLRYDAFYEIASAAAAEGTSGGGPVTAVLPSEVPLGGQRWLLKMHGSLGHPKTIVLTRGQFADFTGASGPSGAILQALLLTKHLMVVGTSMTDDHVLRLIYEVISYRHSHSSKRMTTRSQHFGSIIEVGDNPARRKLYSKHFTCVQMSGASLEDRARELEIFLDAVGAFAATDASWLLDQRFEFLLTDRGRDRAKRLREVAAEIEQDVDIPGDWSAVLAALSNFGAGRPRPY